MLEAGRIRAILFDMDGTLADTDDAYIGAAARVLRPLGFAFPGRDPARFLRWALMTSETPLNWLMTVPDQLGLDRPLAAFSDWIYRRRGQGAPSRFLLVDGAGPLLAELAARYPLALVTSRDRRGAEAFLEQFELRDYFKAVVSALSASRIKPHPAPVLHAAARLAVPPAQCLMVGDTTADIQAGRRAGAQTAGVLCGFGERAELERAGADAILERTSQLAEVLSTI